VRTALDAQPANVRRMILLQTLKLTAAGLISLPFGVGAHDPVTFLGMTPW
jgi:hypothetical protein